MERKDIRLILFGLVPAAYITIFYDIFKELFNDPIDLSAIMIKGIAGILAIAVGLGALAFLTFKKR